MTGCQTCGGYGDKHDPAAHDHPRFHDPTDPDWRDYEAPYGPGNVDPTAWIIYPTSTTEETDA